MKPCRPLVDRPSSLAGVLLVLLCFGPIPWAGAGTDGERLQIADGSGRPVLELRLKGQDLSVSDGSGVPLLAGRRKDSGAIAYSLPDGSPVGTAKGAGERFKLETSDGRLLRKVKRDGDRIKISDNEENAGAAEIRRRGDDKWELELGDESLGKVKSYPDQGRLKVKDRQGETRFTLPGAALTPAPLVLLIPGLPKDQAMALTAEIWLRGW